MGVALPIAVNALNQRDAPGGISAVRQIAAGAASFVIALLLLLLLGAASADAQVQPQTAAPVVASAVPLRDRLTPEVMAVVWPNAEKLELDNGNPSAMAVYKDGRVVGYVFSTLDVVHAPGFSGIPFDVIAGTDLTGHITGSKVIFQRDPHLDGDTLREGQLDTFLTATAGLSSQDPNPNALQTNFVAGASMSARMMRDAVFDSAQLVLIGRGLAKAKALRPTGPVVDVNGFTEMSWGNLLAGGELVHKVITGNDVAAALGKAYPTGCMSGGPPSDPNNN